MILLFKIVEFQGEHTKIITDQFIGIFHTEEQKNEYLSTVCNETGDYLRYRQYKMPYLFQGPVISPAFDIVMLQILLKGITVKVKSAWGGYRELIIQEYIIKSNAYRCTMPPPNDAVRSIIDETDIYEIVNNNPQ